MTFYCKKWNMKNSESFKIVTPMTMLLLIAIFIYNSKVWTRRIQSRAFSMHDRELDIVLGAVHKLRYPIQVGRWLKKYNE